MPESIAVRVGAPPGSELGRAARGGVVTLLGAGVSALAGFFFNVLLARLTGAHGAGVVIQSIAVFTIALSLGRFGLDTTAVWLLPRLMRTDRAEVPRALTILCALSLLLPLSLLLCWLIIWSLLIRPAGNGSEVLDAVTLALLALPAACLMTVALAATRAFGGVFAFNSIGNVLIPVIRPIGLVVATALGGGTLAATGAWSCAWLLGVVLAVLALVRMAAGRVSHLEAPRSSRAELTRLILGYSLPRTVMAAMEQTIIWVDVLLVGILLGPEDAGVYGAAARFVAAGVVAITAMRIVVAPRFSALLAEGRVSEVADLYTATARWVLLLGAPIYLLLAIFAPTVLTWLGPRFSDGVGPMVTLCLGSLVVLAGGNVQSLLLMSGRSGWGAANKAMVMVVNVTGNLILIPRIGIEGAALTWAVSMSIDTSLAAYQVRRGLGVSPAFFAIGGTVLAVSACVAVPALLVVTVGGQGTAQLAVGLLAAVVALLGYCVLDRRRLRIDELVQARSRGRSRATAPSN